MVLNFTLISPKDQCADINLYNANKFVTSARSPRSSISGGNLISSKSAHIEIMQMLLLI